MSAGILSMLGSRSEFDMVHTTAVSLGSLEQPGIVQPDVVILDEELHNTRLFQATKDEELLAANLLALVKLTTRHPKLRLIVLSLNGSSVNVFDKQTIFVSNISDFVQLLDSLPDNDLPV